jgi:hypothetical protein
VRLAKRQAYGRFQRFQTEGQVHVIGKNVRSRCACFWFGLENFSASGVALGYLGFGYVPFKVGDMLDLTIDTGSAIFRRPVHMKTIVRRREEIQIEADGIMVTRVLLGAEILEVDNLHHHVWMDGLTSQGDPYKIDPFSGTVR